jgi:cobyrinic acid a,c-diamide synthase
LDAFFLNSPSALRAAFGYGSVQADLSLIEGNHGLFDGYDESGSGSTAEVARWLSAPILLVLNCARMARSAGAMVLGYQSYEPDTPLAGVILNNVAGSRHETKLRRSIEQATGLPVLGAMPRQSRLEIPDRHLGLLPQHEEARLSQKLAGIQQAVEDHLDLDAIMNIASLASPLDIPPAPDAYPDDDQVTLGVIRDRAFSFYYPENLEALQNHGARLVALDAIADDHIPTLDGLYIGGGFPEVFAADLEENTAFRQALAREIEAGLPVYAECGGLMYLGKSIHWRDQSYAMVGSLPVEVEVDDRPQGHGYVEATVESDNPFFDLGSSLRGHEFHHSKIHGSLEGLTTAYHLQRGTGLGQQRDGLCHRNILAGYTHLHVGGAPEWAAGMVERARSGD